METGRTSRSRPRESLIIVRLLSSVHIVRYPRENPLPFDDLRQWIAALDRAGELKRVKTEVDPILEIAEITDRVSKGLDAKGVPGGPAILFENIKSHRGARVLINQFGSEARMKLALGVSSLDEIADRIRVFMDVKSPQGILDKIKMLPMLADDERTTGMHWQRQKIGAEHYREALRRAANRSGDGAAASRAAVDIMARSSGGSVLAEGGRPSGKMEVAIAIGTDPAVTFSAIVPAPPDVEEYLIAGFLRGAPVELVKCAPVYLGVRAAREVVLEGYIDLDELRTEGPFGDHT